LERGSIGVRIGVWLELEDTRLLDSIWKKNLWNLKSFGDCKRAMFNGKKTLNFKWEL
jgi:hypothetical protein